MRAGNPDGRRPGGHRHRRPARLLHLVLVGATLGAADAGAQVAGSRDATSLRAAEMGGVASDLAVPAGTPRRDAIARAIAAAEWDEAARQIAVDVEQVPRPRPLLVLASQVFLNARRPLNAAVALKKAEALAPLEPQLRLRLALAYVAMGRGDWAKPELERVVREDPNELRAVYWLGRLDYDAGHYASAIARFEAVLRRDPSFVRAYDNLGLCYDAQHQPELALARFREAVRLNRADGAPSPWPPVNLALFLRQRNQPAEAERLLREALGYDRAHPEAHYALGTLLETMDRLDEAIAELIAATRARSGYAEPHYALARIHRRRGDAASADAALAEFRRLRDADEDRRP
jgi:tetratricopeptide (TPR) repeat protein